MNSIKDYENWRDSLHDSPMPEPDEHQYRFYTYDYPADTTLEYTRKGGRAELTLSFGSEDPDMGTEEMIFGSDKGESMAELVSELKKEIQSYLDAADTSSFYEQQGEAMPVAKELYGEYSRTALYAFEAILNETEKELQQKLTWKPVEADQVGWLYSSSRDNDLERGCVGHLRGDFGKSGGELWTSWFDHQPKLKTTAFHDELQNVMSGLREKGGLLHDFASMSRGCRDGLRYEDSFGFKADTPNYTYYLRCIPRRGDYNFYLYSYDKAAQREHALEKADKQNVKQIERHKSKKSNLERLVVLLLLLFEVTICGLKQCL